MGDNQLRAVRLYGKLGAKFGRLHMLAVNSAAEAVQALTVLYPQFRKFLINSKDMGLGYAVFLDKRNISEQELKLQTSAQTIKFAPVILGSKRAGLFQIILGVVVAGIGFLPGMVFLKPFAQSLIFGGIAQLLSPQSKLKTQKDADNGFSSVFSGGSQNVIGYGECVPILYGEMYITPPVLNVSLRAEDK